MKASIFGAIAKVFHPPAAKFCHDCGSELAPDRFYTKYDTQTGKPYYPYEGQKTCPNSMCPSKPGW